MHHSRSARRETASLEGTAKVPAEAPGVNFSASSGEATLLKVRSTAPQARRSFPSAPLSSSPLRALLLRCRRHLSFSNLAQDADDFCRIEADINTFHIKR